MDKCLSDAQTTFLSLRNKRVVHMTTEECAMECSLWHYLRVTMGDVAYSTWIMEHYGFHSCDGE